MIKKLQLKLFGIFGFMAILSTGYAQTQVSGKVTSSDGEALPGVSVVVLGTTIGVSSDGSGNYKLNTPSKGTLVFTFIGMEKQEIAIDGQSTINVEMKDDENVLNEIVVVDYGYGTVKKTDMTGSVSSVSGRELSKMPITSAAQALTGRLPGVNVLTTDGSPDAEVVIRIRGGGSITQDNSPLFVVDGFIVSSIRDIPPTDIESINVLKDAAATAIYGAQASNGVVVITTKKAQAGKAKVSYNAFYQLKQLPKDRKFEVLDPYEFVLANYEVEKLRNQESVERFERLYGVYDDLELYKQKAPNDWQEILFGAPMASQYHNVSLSGGTEMTKLSLSLTHNNDAGLLVNNGFKRNVINFKLNQKISDRLTFNASTRITNTVVDGAGTSGRAQLNIKDAVQTRPVNGVADELEFDINNIDPNDDFNAFIRSLISPLELVEQDWRERTTNDYIINGSLNYKVLKNLTARTTFTTSRRFENDLRYYGPLTGESNNNGGSLPLGQKTNYERTSVRWLNTLNYKINKNPKQKFDFLVGHEIYTSGGNRAFIRSEDFRLSITPEDLFANMTFGRTDRLETSEFTKSNRVSLFGRVDYQLNNKYLATLTVRGDASSKFAKNNRVGVFPAIALGWKLSEEDFLADVTWLDELKLRASYGQTGNDRIDATATQFLFAGSTYNGPGFGNFDNAYYKPTGSTLYNPDIIWETTVNRNLGIDFSLYQSRVTGSLDVYKNTTSDLLLRSAIPSNTGFSTQWNNIGETSNRGIELGLNTFLIDNDDFTLSANFNIGRNISKIEKLDGTDSRFFQSNWANTDLRDQDDYFIEVGGQLGDIYGYVTDGYYATSDFASYDEISGDYTLNEGVASSTNIVGNSELRPGFLKLKDLNDDGIINSEDRKVIGNALPAAQGGLGLSSSFKGFDASVFFNWSFGNDIYNAGKIQFTQFRRVTYGNLLGSMSIDNRFTYLDVDGSVTGIPGEIVTDLDQLAELNAGKEMWSHVSHGTAQAVIHSWAVEDGSFVRLNNLNIGYSLPKSIISKFKMNQLRIYATGNNLKLWTKYSGYDPEVSTSGSGSYSGLTPGVDYSSFPRSRSYTFGVNMTF